MRLLRPRGGVHARVHRPRAGAVRRAVDLRPLRGGGEGRGGPVGGGHRRGGGAGPAHEVLRAVPVLEPAGEPDGGLDIGGEAAPEADPGLSQEAGLGLPADDGAIQELLLGIVGMTGLALAFLEITGRETRTVEE